MSVVKRTTVRQPMQRAALSITPRCDSQCGALHIMPLPGGGGEGASFRYLTSTLRSLMVLLNWPALRRGNTRVRWYDICPEGSYTSGS